MAGNREGPSTAVRAGQVVLFSTAFLLVAAHTVQSVVNTKEHVALVIDPTTFELLGIMVLALVLPRIVSFKASPAGLEIGLEAAERGVKNATVAAGLDTARATAPSEQLDKARAEPLVSIEMSRRNLAQKLRDLAEAAGVSAPEPELPALAKQLKEKGQLPEKGVQAVIDVATAIRQAKLSGSPAPSVAIEIDYATQLLIGLAERKKQELVT